jgi:hypothetical protein
MIPADLTGEPVRSARVKVSCCVVAAQWGVVCKAQVIRQVTRPATTHTTEAAIDDAGATAFSIIDADPYRSNAEHRRQLLRWDLRVGGGAQITSFETGLDDDPTGFGPSATDDGQKVDGSNLRQVTAHTSDLLGFAWPTISDDGTRIAYLQSQGASDGLWQIAGVLQNGTGFHRLTSFPNLQPGYARISGNGQSVGFQRYGPLPVVAGGCEGGSQIAIVDWDATGL